MSSREQVVELYEAGTKIAAICELTGYPRSTVYWFLSQAGIKPNRTRKRTAEERFEEMISLVEVIGSTIVENRAAIDRIEQRLGELENAQTTLAAMVVEKIMQLVRDEHDRQLDELQADRRTAC